MATLRGARILVVDDDPDTLEVECAVLEQHGCTLICVENVEAALAALKEQPADLVITDCAMPGEDGFDLIHRIRNHREFDGIPALMVTAHCDAVLRKQALDEGFAAVLSKPVDPRRLVETVQRLLPEGGGSRRSGDGQ
jgi:CheY-like chemotaxis protein